MQEGVKSTFHDDRIWTDLADGGTMVARANVCATGVEWRRLNLPNEDKLLGRGLYYGAGASEAPLCGGEDVYVVGGGNSAGQAVMHLAKHARSVTMLVRDKTLAASMSQYLSERILGAANIQVQYDVEITGPYHPLERGVAQTGCDRDSSDIGFALSASWALPALADAAPANTVIVYKGKWLGGTGKFEGLSGEFEIRPTPVLISDTLIQASGKKTGVYHITKSPVSQK
jgi:hypothetical protein